MGEVASSLVYLKQKIAAIFPELRRSEPVLSWVDEDEDEVVVTSDEELQVALTALTGPVYKLKVKLGDKAEDGGNSGMGRPTQGSLRTRMGKRLLRRWTRIHTLVL